jgi:1,4-alpha-glucan branching enzyme
VEVLEKTYCNSTWQNQTFDAATAVATQMSERLTDLGHRLGLAGFPTEVEVNDDRIKKTALQYIENHDHFRFVCNFGTISRDSNDLLKEGDRSRWYKVQPYLIAMMMAKGIPMLWQGQEFCENYYVPDGGLGRVVMFRPMRWDYFYDSYGKKMIWLVRRLMKLRRKPQFQYGDHLFYDDPLDILETLDADKLSMPSLETISWILLVETPWRYDSSTALIKAFSTREYLSKTLVSNEISRN